jgi:O-antigen/teichoic acid export membrane protein
VAFIFIESLVGLLSGYLLWITLTRIATPEIIGTSSTVISISIIFATMATIGVPVGVSRFLAKSFYEKKVNEAKIYVKKSLLLISLGIISSFAALFIINEWIYVTLDQTLIIFSMLLIGSSAISKLLNSIVIASLKTKIIPQIMVVVSSVRIILVVILVLMDTGSVGVLTGYASFEILTSILLGFAVIRMLRDKNPSSPIAAGNHSFKTILSASLPSWIPKLITVLSGANLGTIIVFGSNGSAEAASYFLSYTISLAVFSIVLPLFTVAYPALAAMSDGRKRLTWRIIKISMIISVPLSSSIFFYSTDVIGLLGYHYADASLLLRLFLIAIFPNSISLMIGQLVYAYGNYRQVLYIGLASSIPTTLLYLILVPILGSTGAVISYLVGSIGGLVMSTIISKKIGMQLHWKVLGLISIISVVPAFIYSYLQLNFVIGIIITLLTSYIVFLKFRIISKSDVDDTLNVLPKELARPITTVVHKVGKILNSDY